MEDRLEKNLALRENAHKDLDGVRALIDRVCDEAVRAAFETNYDYLHKWIEDRTKRVQTEKLQRMLVAIGILSERVKTKLSLENGTNGVTNFTPDKHTGNMNVPQHNIPADVRPHALPNGATSANDTLIHLPSAPNQLDYTVASGRAPEHRIAADVRPCGLPTLAYTANGAAILSESSRMGSAVAAHGAQEHRIAPAAVSPYELPKVAQTVPRGVNHVPPIPNWVNSTEVISQFPELRIPSSLRPPEHAMFQKPHDTFIIPHTSAPNQVGRTVGMGRAPSHGYPPAVRPYGLLTDVHTANGSIKAIPSAPNPVYKEIYEMAGSYDFLQNDLPKSREQSAERLAMKYPRKKVGTVDGSEMFITPTRPSSPLFHRRQDIFPKASQTSSSSTACTYGEYKRQMFAKKVWESRSAVPTSATEHVSKANRALSTDPRLAHYEKVGKIVPSRVSLAKPDKCHEDAEVTTSTARVAEQTLPQNEISPCKSNNDGKSTADSTVQCSEVSSLDLVQTHQTAKAADSACKKPASTKAAKTADPETTTIVEAAEMIVASTTPSTSRQSNSSSGKTNSTYKSNKPTRELNDLLSYTSEYMANCKRKEENDQALLAQFGISKQLVVLLPKVVHEEGIISSPAQTKPLLTSNKLPAKVQMKRRNSICIDIRKLVGSGDLRKSEPTQAKRTKDDAKSKKEPRAHKSTCQKLAKRVDPVQHNSSKATESANSKQQKESTNPAMDSKPTKKRKSQKKPLQHSAAKKQCLDKEEQSGNLSPELTVAESDPIQEATLLRPVEPTSANTASDAKFTYNNNIQVHCHSEYMMHCHLCDFKDIRQADIVSHYVYQHPACEVIVSRITPEQAKIVKKNPFAVGGKRVVSRHGSQTISFRCHFCEMRNTLKESDWVHHLVGHTGEYRFRCRACPAMARTVDETVTHEEICGDPEMIVCNDVTFEENHLYGYICELCNFIQIRRFNMEKHLRCEHPFEEASCVRFSLVNYENYHKCLPSDSQNIVIKPELLKNNERADTLVPVAIVKEESCFKKELDELEIPFMEEHECIEKPEVILPDFPDVPVGTAGHVIQLSDCENSNDSNCTLPMVPMDERDIEDVADEENLTNTHFCDQGIILEKVKEENMVNEVIDSMSQHTDGDEQNSRPEQTIANAANNISNSSTANSQWEIIPTHSNNNKIVLKKTSLPTIGNISMNEEDHDGRQSVRFPLIPEDCFGPLPLREAVISAENFEVPPLEGLRPETVSTTRSVPLLRPRHLPGDALSCRLEAEQKVVNMTQPAYVPWTMRASSFRDVITASSTRTTPTSGGNVQIVYPVKALVKPWIECSSTRCSSHHLKTITYECLGSFYKCMGDGCDFHTDEKECMLRHLSSHMFSDTVNQSFSHDKTWLECCYCKHSALNAESLVSHLNHVHKHCAFQCNLCFYRSREASSAIIHQSTYHVDNESCNVIFECSKQLKRYCTADQDTIIETMNRTVERLTCTVCNVPNFFDLLAFKTHLMSHKTQYMRCHICQQLMQPNGMLKHLKLHKVFLYQCVYCLYGTDQKNVIKHHVSSEHPERICCFHTRQVTGKGDTSTTAVPSPLIPFVRVEETIPLERLPQFCYK